MSTPGCWCWPCIGGEFLLFLAHPLLNRLLTPKADKILSPTVKATVESSILDDRARLLYVTTSTTSTLWFLPLRRGPIRAVSVLALTEEQPSQNSNPNSNGNASSSSPSSSHSTAKLDKENPLGDSPHEPSFAQVASSTINTATAVDQTPTGTQRLSQQSTNKPSASPKKYLIQSHTDLYQPDDLARLFFFGAGSLLCVYLRLAGTALCVLGMVFLGPVMRAAKGAVMSWRVQVSENGNATATTATGSGSADSSGSGSGTSSGTGERTSGQGGHQTI